MELVIEDLKGNVKRIHPAVFCGCVPRIGERIKDETIWPVDPTVRNVVYNFEQEVINIYVR
jgi:AICAR transformylase/IMP cyclohydrolase PurH